MMILFMSAAHGSRLFLKCPRGKKVYRPLVSNQLHVNTLPFFLIYQEFEAYYVSVEKLPV